MQDEKESDEKVKLYCYVDPFLCNMVTSTTTSTYWFIALIGGKRYLTNDIHTWHKRRIFKPVMHYTAVEYQVRNCFWAGKVIIDGRTTPFKYNGCFFHGFIEYCHENNGNHPVGMPFGCSCYTMKQNTGGLTKARFTIRSRWEHKWAAMKRNRWGAHGLSQDQTAQALIPRDVFSGSSSMPFVCTTKQPPMKRYTDHLL